MTSKASVVILDSDEDVSDANSNEGSESANSSDKEESADANSNPARSDDPGLQMAQDTEGSERSGAWETISPASAFALLKATPATDMSLITSG